ncbi:MAG: RCC1 domain-containing protein [Oscillospiraceae bacterium]|nr:RCC1 domain-containing protein [Oscillospiraceae bacterium]
MALLISAVAPVAVATDADADDEWIAVSAGHFHNLFIRSDGTLWAWGLNDPRSGTLDRIINYYPVRVDVASDRQSHIVTPGDSL